MPKLDGLSQIINPDGEYYVQDKRQVVGNCLLFWGKERKGYVCELDKAGIYRGSEVLRMRDTDVPWPRALIEQNAILHVREEPLARAIDKALGSEFPDGYQPPADPARRWIDVNSFEDFWAPVQVALEGHMSDNLAQVVTRDLFERLGGKSEALRSSLTNATKEQLRGQGHSVDRNVTCPACGDLDGCHKWDVDGNSYSTER